MHPASWQRVLVGEFERRSDVRLHVIVLRKHFARNQTFERNGVVFHLIKTWGGLRAPSFYWLDTYLIRRELELIQPDLVHAWGTEGGAALVAGRLDVPCLITMQGLINWIGEMVPMSRFDHFHGFLEDVALKGAVTVTAESSFAIRYLRGRHPHLDLLQLEHAPLPLFHEVVRTPQLQPMRLIFVGTFSYLKGGDMLLRALAELQPELDFELICAGVADEAFINGLKAEIPERVWKRVTFAGSLQAHQIAAELSKAALMVYPTRCDNSPNAVKEAVVAGVPVVASAIGGIVDYVVPGENGHLFESGNTDALVEALRKAARHESFSKGVVNDACLRRMREYLSSTRMAEKFLGAYRRVLGNR